MHIKQNNKNKDIKENSVPKSRWLQHSKHFKMVANTTGIWVKGATSNTDVFPVISVRKTCRCTHTDLVDRTGHFLPDAKIKACPLSDGIQFLENRHHIKRFCHRRRIIVSLSSSSYVRQLPSSHQHRRSLSLKCLVLRIYRRLENESSQ